MVMQKVSGLGREIPPFRTHVVIYFVQKGMSRLDAERFFAEYESVQWRTQSSTPIRNWKAIAAEWIWQLKQSRKSTKNDK